MLFSSGSSIYGRESVEVPEEKANIQSLRGEAQDLAVQTEQFHVDFLVCIYGARPVLEYKGLMYRVGLVKRNSYPPQDDLYRPQHNPNDLPYSTPTRNIHRHFDLVDYMGRGASCDLGVPNYTKLWAEAFQIWRV